MKTFIKTFVISSIILWGILMLLPVQPVKQNAAYVKKTPQYSYQRNTEVDQMFADLGIKDITAIEVKISDTIPCSASGQVRGCSLPYTDHTTIYLTNNWVNADALRKRATLAHEYLHWQWVRGNRASSTDLMAIYNSNRYFQSRMDVYSKLGIGSDNFLNELNAIECTEWSDSALPFTLNAYCAKYVPNRNVLPSYFY